MHYVGNTRARPLQGEHVRPSDELAAGGGRSVQFEWTEHGKARQASTLLQTVPSPAYPTLHPRHARPLELLVAGGGRSVANVNEG